jgi:S-(hydroxymethyl)glutathione dehydrogenase/alcohol dehydrogenase
VRNVARVAPGDTVCVIGVGGVGMQVVAAARIARAAVIIAVDRNAETLERALRHGATHAVDATGADPAAAVRELSDGGVDHAFEVVGRPETIRLAWDAIRPGGSAVVVGLVPRGVEVAVPGIEFLSDKSLRGTYYGSGDAARELPDLARLAVDGELDLAGVVTHTVGLDGVERSLQRLRGGDGGRTVVVIDEDLAGIERGALA